GARVGACTLAAQRQTAAVAQTTIRAEVDQALDADADFATQVAFDRELRHFLAQFLDLGFGQRLDLGRRIDSRGRTDLLPPRAADAENALQTDTHVFLYRQIDTCNARHLTSLQSAVCAVNCKL